MWDQGIYLPSSHDIKDREIDKICNLIKILQMKIGVFLTKKPQEGKPITEELLNSLVNLINFKNLTIVFFLVSNDYDGKYLVFSEK